MTDLDVVLPDGTRRPYREFFWPQATLMLASLLLCLCMFLPFWSIRMNAPQYPDGLTTTIFINHIQGDVEEIDGLNHYLGMPPLDEGGKLERKIALQSLIGMSILVLAAVFTRHRWGGLLGIPALTFPWVFLLDLQRILYQYGHSIDPNSALGDAVKPFTPPVLGVGQVGQFTTLAQLESGFYVAILAAGLVTLGAYLHHRIYAEVQAARQRAALRCV